MAASSSPLAGAGRRGAGGALARGYASLRLTLAEAVVPVLFPDRCVGCGVFETALCRSCAATLEPADRTCCPRCGQPDVRIGDSPRCPACFTRELSFAAARSAFVYEHVAKELVVALKFGGRRALAPLMAERAWPAFTSLLAGRGRVVVTWVPAHPAAERRRGYNQAEVLARALAARPVVAAQGGPAERGNEEECVAEGGPAGGGMAEDAAIPGAPGFGGGTHGHSLAVVPLVRKVRRTAGQRTLSRTERQRNLEGAFVFAGPARGASDVVAATPSSGPAAGADGARARATSGRVSSRMEVPFAGTDAVVLVDDVYTTGATVEAVSQVLVAGTGLPVLVFTFARTPASLSEGVA